MSFKRSWSRRLAALLSAVMVVSAASPVSVPAMEVQADDMLSVADEGTLNVQEEDAPAITDEEPLSLTEDETLNVPEDDLVDGMANGSLTEEQAEGTELTDVDDPVILDPDMADDTYSGKLVLDTVSEGIIRKIAYKFDDGEWNEVDVTQDGPKAPIDFTGIKKITFKAPGAPDDGKTIPLYDNEDTDGYQIRFSPNDSVTYPQFIEQSHKEVSFELKDTGFVKNGTFTMYINTLINRYDRKKGNLIIRVASENKIPGTDKIISINEVKVQLGNHAIAYDVSGNIVTGNYRQYAVAPFVEVSQNNIGTAEYGGTITIPYWCAKDATIWINDTSAYSGNDEKGTRYAYTIGDGFFYSEQANISDPSKKKYTVDLAEEIGTDTHVTIGVRQMSFDPEVKFSTVSNRIMTKFIVTADDGGGNTVPYEIDALSDDVIKTQVFEKARKLVFDYDGFTVKDTASAEYKRDSGNDKNWVYRIDYKDTDGKDVSKSLFESGQQFYVETDNNGRFPAEIKVSAIPNVKVTLSANGVRQYKRNIGDIFNQIVWEAESKGVVTNTVTNGNYSFWVEPHRIVSINKLEGAKGYIFPYVEGASTVYKGVDRCLQFTLPEITQDREFSVSFYEFDLDNKDLFTVVNGIRNDDGQQGQASVSINGFGGIYVGTDTDTISQLKDHKVLISSLDDFYTEKLEVNIKMDSTEALEYLFDRISYDYYDHEVKDGVEKPVEAHRMKDLTPIDAGSFYPSYYRQNFAVTQDSHGNYIATVYIPTRWVVFKLIKDGRFDITVTEHENKRKSSITLTEGTSGTIETASVKLGDEYRYALNRPGYSASGTLPYGSDIFLKAEPADGYGLVSVDIICPSNSDNNETITDEKKLAAFLGDEGYKYKLREGVSVRFNTEPVYCATVRYKTGSDEPGLHSGKYSIDHKRPVLVQYRKGNTSPAGYNCDIYVGSEKITSNEGINKTGDVYTVDANSGGLAGKNVTFKFYMGDGSKTDSSLRTLVLAFDKADTGVKFGSDKYSVPLGAEKEIPVSITGSFEASAVLASDKTYDKTGLTYRLDTSKKRFIFSSANDSKADTYTINIVNPNDKNVVYGSVKVELETTTVKAAPAPVVQIIGTTNRGVTVGLKAQKIDTKIKGLCYELQVKTKDQKKGYFKTSRGVEAGDKIYIPVTTSSIYVDMFTDSAASASQYAGDPDALFVATARLIQLRSDNKTVVIGSDNWSDEKNGTFSTKEGARYETKLRLKKISKGTIYNTMSSGNAYRIGVVYSKKTAIQRLDRTKLQLLTGSGEEVNYPVGKSIEDYLEIGDDYTILFHPGGMESIRRESYYGTELKCLPVGTYIIRAYALEPDSVEVSASIKVKVERGANSINLKNVSNIIYKQPGKAVSLQIKAPAIAESHIATSGATVFVEFVTPKMKYEIIDEKNTGGFVKISKSGKITIDKKLVPDNTEFKVRVTVDDFTRNPGMEEIVEEKTIKVRSNSDLDGLTLAYIPDYNIIKPEYDFNPVEGKLNRLGNSYYLNELTSYTLDQDRLCWTYEPRFWITVFERNRNVGKNSFVPVDFKISGAGRLVETRNTQNLDTDGTYGTCAGIEITDIDKDIKITAYAKDGSGRKIKNYKVRVKSANGKLGIFISDGQISQPSYEKQNSLHRIYGKTDLTFDSYAMEKEGVNMIIDSEFYDEKSLMTVRSVARYKMSSVKGGRVVQVHSWQNKIYPTASQTTFIITDLTNKKDYKVTINNKGYIDRNKKTKVTATNTLYDAEKGKKTVDGVIFSHLDFSTTENYTDYDSVKWNTVKFHVDSAEDNQYVMVRIVSSVKRVGGEYKVATKPLGDCFFKLMDEQSAQETEKGRDKIERDGAAYPIKLTGKDFSIDFYDRSTKKFEMVPGSYKLVITPVRREGYFKYQTLANPATVTLKVVTPPKANVNPGTSIEFGTSEGTVAKGKYTNFLASPVYKEQGILYKELKDVNIDGKMNDFRKNFNMTDNRTGKIKYVGTDPIGIKDKDRNAKLQGWLILEYQQVDGTVVEKPVKVKIVSKGEIKK